MIVDIVWRIGNLNALPRQSPRPRPPSPWHNLPDSGTGRPRSRCHRSAPQRLPVVDQAGLQMRSFEYEEFAKDAVSQLPKEMPVRWTIPH